MYPGHVAGFKRLHRSAVIMIVLSKDSQWRKQGHQGGSTDVEEGRGPSGDYWGGRVNMIRVSRGREWRRRKRIWDVGFRV